MTTRRAFLTLPLLGIVAVCGPVKRLLGTKLQRQWGKNASFTLAYGTSLPRVADRIISVSWVTEPVDPVARIRRTS